MILWLHTLLVINMTRGNCVISSYYIELNNNKI